MKTILTDKRYVFKHEKTKALFIKLFDSFKEDLRLEGLCVSKSKNVRNTNEK